MKKYLRYIWKYVENFGFVNRVVWLTLKYKIFLLTASNKKIIDHLIHLKSVITEKKHNDINAEGLGVLTKKILGKMPFNVSCLLKSIVLTITLKKYTDIHIKIGLKYKGNHLVAHAWTNVDYEDPKYKILSKI